MEVEQNVSHRIREFQRKFGIVEEGQIVSEDDYESTHVVSYSESEGGRMSSACPF